MKTLEQRKHEYMTGDSGKYRRMSYMVAAPYIEALETRVAELEAHLRHTHQCACSLFWDTHPGAEWEPPDKYGVRHCVGCGCAEEGQHHSADCPIAHPTAEDDTHVRFSDIVNNASDAQRVWNEKLVRDQNPDTGEDNHA